MVNLNSVKLSVVNLNILFHDGYRTGFNCLFFQQCAFRFISQSYATINFMIFGHSERSQIGPYLRIITGRTELIDPTGSDAQ